MPQEGTERGGKIQPDLLLHLHLVDAGQLELDRVFSGDDVRVGLVQLGDGRIERIGFAAAGRPRHQNHPIRLENSFLELRQGFGLDAELGHIEPEILFVEQPHHDFFAVQRGQH